MLLNVVIVAPRLFSLSMNMEELSFIAHIRDTLGESAVEREDDLPELQLIKMELELQYTASDVTCDC